MVLVVPFSSAHLRRHVVFEHPFVIEGDALLFSAEPVKFAVEEVAHCYQFVFSRVSILSDLHAHTKLQISTLEPESSSG